MKFGVRKPSPRKSFKARTSAKYKRAVKRALIPGYGKKGMGWIKNPKKAMYNKIYNKTTVSAKSLFYTGKSTKSRNSYTSKKVKQVKSYNSNQSVNFNQINENYITLFKGFDVKRCKMGYSFTNLIFQYLAPLCRLDFKNFLMQIVLFHISAFTVILCPVYIFLMPYYYNKVYIKDLLEKGYKPISYEDVDRLEKMVIKSKNTFVDRMLNLNAIDRHLVNIKENNLFRQMDELNKKIQNMEPDMENNIIKFKEVLNKILETSPSNKEVLDVLEEITIKEEYLVCLSNLQTAINILHNPKLSTYIFKLYIDEIRDIYLPKLRESNEKNLNVCHTPLCEIEAFLEEKTAQYERKVKREEKEYKDKRNYVVFDLETTGLSPINNEITEIGAIKVVDGQVVDTFNMLIKPNGRISQKITDLTGITNEMVVDKPSIEEVLPLFMDFIGKLPLVAHNADFDYGFLNENYKRIYGKDFRRKKSCTMKLYRKWYKENYYEKAPCAKLGDVILELLGEYEYKQYLGNSHRGLNDAEFTQKIYEKMI